MDNNQHRSRLKFFGFSIILILGLAISLLENGQAAITTPFQGGSYYALIIGNNNYQDKEGVWKSLNNPINDAISVVDVLKRKYAFSEGNIHLITDGTRGDILRALNNIIKQVSPNDSVLVFYAGHGYLNDDTDEAFWIPVDAQGADDTNYLSHETIKRKLGVIADKASHVLLVSDSCFSGTMVRGVNLVADTTTPDYYSKNAKLKSVQIVAAGGREFVDDNFRSTGHSPFTYFFIKELENNANQYLAVGEFITNIEKNVANNVKQKPVTGRLFGAGDESGEFIFTQAKLSAEVILKEIKQLLKSAEIYFKKEQFIDPPGNNARGRWEEVLRLDTGNQEAKQGLNRVAKHFVKVATQQIKLRNFEEAEKSLSIAEDIVPNFSLIKSARETLGKERDYVAPPVITW